MEPMMKPKPSDPIRLDCLDGQHYRAAWEPLYEVYVEHAAEATPSEPVLTFEEFAALHKLPPHSAFMR
jgi:hypothetical protein